MPAGLRPRAACSPVPPCTPRAVPRFQAKDQAVSRCGSLLARWLRYHHVIAIGYRVARVDDDLVGRFDAALDLERLAEILRDQDLVQLHDAVGVDDSKPRSFCA